MKLNPIAKALLLAFPSGLAICAANVAYAQTTQQAPQPAKAATEVLDRVVVTATKRETAVQDVPFSINAQTEERSKPISLNGAAGLGPRRFFCASHTGLIYR